MLLVLLIITKVLTKSDLKTMPDEKAHWADPKGDVVLHLRRMVLNSDTILEFFFYGHIFLYDWGGTSLRNVNQGF